MPTVKILDGVSQYELDGAILFYKNDDNRYLATKHQIDPEMRLRPGIPLDFDHLREMFKSNNTADKLRMVPASILAMSASSIVWTVNQKRNPIFFNMTGKNEKPLNQYNGIEIIWPNLVFKMEQKTLYVWARTSTRRPGSNSTLFRAPFFNLFASNAVCMPQTQPYTWNHIFEAIAFYEKIFFNSAFTHFGGAGQLVQYPGGAIRFWLDYCGKFESGKNAPTSFPVEVLVQLPQKLRSILQ